jgi:predicted enzyme related to lactoylglutathione lyase
MADKLLGSFVWCELMTTDPAAAQSFYKRVVGWTTTPFGPDGAYTVLNNSSGSGRGGIMKIPAEAKGMPPNWMMYVGTPDVDATAMRLAQLGGRVHKQPSDIPTVGRFAVVADPYGAVFNIFTPINPGQDMGKSGTGDFSWFELYTPNPEGAWKFYETLFGWEKTTAMDMGEMGVYQMFGRGGGIPNGGIMKPPPGAPAAWMPYALVKDAKASAAAATANGGKIVNGPMEVPGGDWIAQGIDPQGAMFAVHSLNPATANRQPAAASPAKKRAAKKKAAKKSAVTKSAPKKQKARPAKRSAKAAKKKAAKKTAKKKPARKAAKKKSAKRKK